MEFKEEVKLSVSDEPLFTESHYSHSLFCTGRNKYEDKTIVIASFC